MLSSLIAVHGLDGHREKTWIADNGVFWLRDELPKIITNSRILTWGYDARTHGSTPLSCQTLFDHAISLIADLSLERRRTKTDERPIVFLAHSIGGIIVKSVTLTLTLVGDNPLTPTCRLSSTRIPLGKVILNITRRLNCQPMAFSFLAHLTRGRIVSSGNRSFLMLLHCLPARVMLLSGIWREIQNGFSSS